MPRRKRKPEPELTRLEQLRIKVAISPDLLTQEECILLKMDDHDHMLPAQRRSERAGYVWDVPEPDPFYSDRVLPIKKRNLPRKWWR